LGNVSMKIPALAALSFVVLSFAGLAIAQQSYSYKCPKCGVIMTYGQPGNYTCPNDGWTLIRQF